MSTIFIFRRDLRLIDNIGLIECIKIIKQPKLRLFYGKPSKVLNKLLNKLESINTVVANTDYTPYARRRDQELYKVCINYNVDFILTEDYLLNPVASITNVNNEIYTKFTPYWNKAKKIPVSHPQNTITNNYWPVRKHITGEFNINNLHKFYKSNPYLLHHGGRTNGLKQLQLSKQQKKYNKTHNCLELKTTELSAHIKFGTISIREVYWYLQRSPRRACSGPRPRRGRCRGARTPRGAAHAGRSPRT